jgi:dipeptidase
MRIGSNVHYPNFGMNEKGVAITMNDGDKTDIKHPGKGRAGMSAAITIRMVVTNCETAEQAVEMIKHVGRNGIKLGSNASYLIADPKRAFLVDLAHGYAEVKEITGGTIVISNTWHLPGGEEISTKPMTGGRSDRAREANTRMALQKSRQNGKYTVRGCIDVSRLACGKALKDKYPYRVGKGGGNSLGSSCFELDGEYPAYLSYAWLALGPQQHTIYLPIPMSLKQMPEKLRDGSWAMLAYDLREKVGTNPEYLAEFSKLEDKFIAEVEAARQQARTLLKAGRNDEAAKLLNGTFEKHFAEADALLTKVHDEAGAAGAAKFEKR